MRLDVVHHRHHHSPHENANIGKLSSLSEASDMPSPPPSDTNDSETMHCSQRDIVDREECPPFATMVTPQQSSSSQMTPQSSLPMMPEVSVISACASYRVL